MNFITFLLCSSRASFNSHTENFFFQAPKVSSSFLTISHLLHNLYCHSRSSIIHHLLKVSKLSYKNEFAGERKETFFSFLSVRRCFCFAGHFIFPSFSSSLLKQKQKVCWNRKIYHWRSVVCGLETCCGSSPILNPPKGKAKSIWSSLKKHIFDYSQHKLCWHLWLNWIQGLSIHIKLSFKIMHTYIMCILIESSVCLPQRLQRNQSSYTLPPSLSVITAYCRWRSEHSHFLHHSIRSRPLKRGPT